MKKRLLNNLLLIILLGCVAWGIPLHQNVTTGVLLTGWIIIAELVVLTLAYFVAAGVNFRGLIPRLLLQNRLMEYALTLVISTAFFVVIEICFDWLLIDIYDIPSEASWFFSQNTVGIVFRIISTMAAYAISLVGLAIILFQRLWEQSGNRVNDMEEQNARSEVKKARSRIDSEATRSRAPPILQSKHPARLRPC